MKEYIGKTAFDFLEWKKEIVMEKELAGSYNENLSACYRPELFSSINAKWLINRLVKRFQVSSS